MREFDSQLGGAKHSLESAARLEGERFGMLMCV